MSLAEQIARIIDPYAWREPITNMRHTARDSALAKAEQAIAIVRAESAKEVEALRAERDRALERAHSMALQLARRP